MHLDATALILVDWQQAFRDLDFWGQRCNLAAETKAEQLIRAWRQAGRPIFHVHHLSLEPGSPLREGTPGALPEPFAELQGDEPRFTKSVNSGFIGTDLEASLRAACITNVVICGVSTDHCVSTTARMAANLGFGVHLVGDACFTFDRTSPDGDTIPASIVHQVHLASLHGEFAEVIVSDDVLKALKA